MAASDWAATRLIVSIERVAEALLVEEEGQQRILPALAVAPMTSILTAYPT